MIITMRYLLFYKYFVQWGELSVAEGVVLLSKGYVIGLKVAVGRLHVIFKWVVFSYPHHLIGGISVTIISQFYYNHLVAGPLLAQVISAHYSIPFGA